MRIQDLDQITNEEIDLSQFIPLDDPGQTFKATLLQVADFMQAHILNNVFNVGSTLYRVDNRTPNEAGFPGVWAKASADVTLATGKADGTDTGSYTGSNTPAVPLLAHTHTADQPSHSHTATQAAHSHASSFTAWKTEACSDGCGEGTMTQNTGWGGQHTINNTVGNAAPAITIGSADPAITIGSTGTASPTIDVRGAHLNGQLWIRTS